MSINSFPFFLSDARSFPPLRSSRSPLSPPRTCVSSSPVRSRTPHNWIFPISLTSYCSLPLHLRVSAVARGFLPSDLSPHSTAATLRSHFFFGYDGFLRPVWRVDFFLIRTRIRPPMHQCVGPGRPPGFFHRDNVPGYFRVYLPSPRPLFYRRIFPYHRVSPRDITYSRIISHVILRISPSNALSLPSPTPSPLLYTFDLFLRPTPFSFPYARYT